MNKIKSNVILIVSISWDKQHPPSNELFILYGVRTFNIGMVWRMMFGVLFSSIQFILLL